MRSAATPATWGIRHRLHVPDHEQSSKTPAKPHMAFPLDTVRTLRAAAKLARRRRHEFTRARPSRPVEALADTTDADVLGTGHHHPRRRG